MHNKRNAFSRWMVAGIKRILTRLGYAPVTIVEDEIVKPVGKYRI